MYVENDRLYWEPYAKPSKVVVPLHAESAHHYRAHSWPVAECTRLARNSSSEAASVSALTLFVHNMVAMHLDGDKIAQVIDRAHC